MSPFPIDKSLIDFLGLPVGTYVRNHEKWEKAPTEMIYVLTDQPVEETGQRELVPVDRSAVKQCLSLWKIVPLDEYFQGSARTVIDMLRAGW